MEEAILFIAWREECTVFTRAPF